MKWLLQKKIWHINAQKGIVKFDFEKSFPDIDRFDKNTFQHPFDITIFM